MPSASTPLALALCPLWSFRPPPLALNRSHSPPPQVSKTLGPADFARIYSEADELAPVRWHGHNPGHAANDGQGGPREGAVSPASTSFTIPGAHGTDVMGLPHLPSTSQDVRQRDRRYGRTTPQHSYRSSTTLLASISSEQSAY